MDLIYEYFRWEMSVDYKREEQIVAEDSATNIYICTQLNHLRLLNREIFKRDAQTFFFTVSYIMQLLYKRCVTKTIFLFLLDAAYFVSWREITGKEMSIKQIKTLLTLTGFTESNYLSDFPKMIKKVERILHEDYEVVTLWDYISEITDRKICITDRTKDISNLAMIISTSIELNKYNLWCKAIAFLMWISRHISLISELSDDNTFANIPIYFISPQTLEKKRDCNMVIQEDLEACCHDIQHFYWKYISEYSKTNAVTLLRNVKRDSLLTNYINLMPTIDERPEDECPMQHEQL